jgi:hypothetical protein
MRRCISWEGFYTVTGADEAALLCAPECEAHIAKLGRTLRRLEHYSRAAAKLFSKRLVEDAVMCHHGEPDHNGNKRYLRADAQNDILFDPLVAMNPAMKSLKRPQRFIREVGVNGVEGIGQHGPKGAE